MFHVIEQLNEFALFTDNFLNRRAIQLNGFYVDNLHEKKEIFQECLLKMVSKKIKEDTLKGKTIPLEEQAKLQQMILFSPDHQDIYTQIMSFENQIRMQKWTQKMIKTNFDTLYQIIQDHKQMMDEQQQHSIQAYIGGTLSWIGSGAGYLISS